jgi:hypothetical protein
MFNSSVKVHRYAADTNEEDKAAQVPSRSHLWSVWKSSILPFMYHGPDDDYLRTEYPAAVPPLEEVEEYAATTKARLNYTDKGWNLVKTD